MNSVDEIRQAFADLRAGRFGPPTWSVKDELPSRIVWPRRWQKLLDDGVHVTMAEIEARNEGASEQQRPQS